MSSSSSRRIGSSTVAAKGGQDSDHRKLLRVGTRITVYWPADDAWYKGTVASEIEHHEDGTPCVLIDYDDGETRWMNINDTTKWRRSTKPEKFIKKHEETITTELIQSKIDKLQVGSRLSIWWPHEKEYYTGTLTKIKTSKSDDDDNADDHEKSSCSNTSNANNKTLLYHIKYDDGDKEWVNLLHRKFKRVQAKAIRLRVGYRVSIYNQKKNRYYPATVIKIKPKRGPYPHCVEYDNDETKNKKEWLNLNVHPFLDIMRPSNPPCLPSAAAASSVAASTNKPGPAIESCNNNSNNDDDDVNDIPRAPPHHIVNANTLKKRKREFLKDPPPPLVGNSHEDTSMNEQDTRKRAKTEVRNSANIITNHPSTANNDEIYQEMCGICRSMTRLPRAVSCHHLFCKRCIRDKLTKKSDDDDDEPQCPLCHTVTLDMDLIVKYNNKNKDHVSFKPVEALDRTTAQVVKAYSSASAASIEYLLTAASKPRCAMALPFRIIEACQSKRRDDREFQGYYWRFQGSKERILRVGEGINEGIAIEQVDIETGKVIETFSSSRKAYEKTGVSRCTIKRVLQRQGKAVAGGFFWRFEGESHGPWPDPEPTNLNPVEQLDFETGDLLASFVSLAEAKKAMGMRPNASCIRDVCNGKGRATAKGFFWRWKGSDRVPNHMMGVQKVIQIRKTIKGKVIKEFRTSRDAQAYFGYQECWSTLCQQCREKSFYKGYYWQYRMLREKQRPEEEVVGKRVRVKQDNDTADEWLEGKIAAFDSESGKHEILFDSGTVEHHLLSELQYEWKNDQGQKPVEQLDLKTGKVLDTFTSISEAAASIGESARVGGIVAVCVGRYRSCAGFFWRYKGSNALPTKPKGQRKVEQLCLKTGRVINSFDTISAAAKALGISSPGISYCCNGRNSSKSAAGYGWRFAKTDDNDDDD